jgi:hypothetical protein
MSQITSESVKKSEPRRKKKETAFTIAMLGFALLLFVGWPITHVFLAKFYMQYVGFVPGSYTISQVQLSGACGLFPVFILAYLGFSPKNKGGIIIVFSLWFVLLVAMFMYLILTGAFPKGLYPGVFMQFFLAVIVPVLYSSLIKKPRLE